MANPTKYQPSYSFTGWQASNPSRPLPAQRVDIEFQNLRLTTDEIIVALAEIRRSDGKLSGGIVDLAALSDEVRQKLGGGNGASGPIAISDVTGLQTALDGKSQAGHSHAISSVNGLQGALDGKETRASKGQPGGYAGLGSDGKVPAAQLQTQSGGADAKEPVYFTKTDTLTSSKLFSRADQATDVRAQKLVETTSPFNGNYAGGNISAFHVRHVAEGTERNGPRGAALGASISMFKEGFGTGTAKGGEMDGLYIVLRQDSPRTAAGGNGPNWGDDVPDRGDGCGVLIDAAVYQDVGFVGGIEGVTHMLSNSQVNANGGAVPIKTIGYQLGCIDSARTNSIGLFLGATTGASTAGILITNNEANGGYFENFISLNTHAGTVFSLNRRGELGIGARLDNGTTINPSVHIRLQANYSLGFLNAAKDVQLMNLNQNGDLGLYGVLSATNLIASGTISANSTISTSGSVQASGNITANGTIQGGTVQASGNIIAGGQVRATTLKLAIGGDPNNGAGGEAGMIFIGPQGKLRVYDGQTGQARIVQYEPG